MKILCCWLVNYNTISYEELHYHDSLKKLGHNVRVLPQEDINDANLLEVIDLWKPDLLFVKRYKTGGVRPETYRYISEHTKTTTFCYHGDDQKEFDSGEKWDSRHMANCFNWIGTNYMRAIDWYKAAGQKNIVYSQYAANEQYCQSTSIKKAIDVSFCGSIKMPRIKFLNELVCAGIRPQVFGKGWSEGQDVNGRVLSPVEYISMINQSKINLDLNRDSSDTFDCQQIKGRDFEVPMCGGFLLVEHFDDLKYYYKIGKEIETFKSPRECADKIRFYLKRQEKRELIAKAGQRRALKDHTYTVRFKKLLRQIKLK